jgi:membrane-associated phospholipid phosphatase
MKYAITKSLFSIIFLITIFCLINSCSKKITEHNLTYKALNPSKPDTNAGAWLPILLTSATEFPCATPISATSADYILQLNEIKSFQNEITDAEMDLVDYWGAGAVLRWNEIMRELVAKHNVPPNANADGTFPSPSANNPLAYPLFPFSNPPYAARAYAYLSTSQYDALIAAMHFKQLYNRKAPYLVDSNIKTLLPRSVAPSFPSEDATVMGVSAEILKLLFPGDQDFINAKVEEHKRARLIAGANVRSDLDAGEALGKLVATKFVARARTDKANLAGGNAALWESLKAAAIAKGETAWISQEIPARPGMLAAYGNVKGFLFDSITLVNQIRPVAPPSTNSAQFKQETDEIYNISINLTKEQIAIAEFWGDGVKTYTPPGHWNYIAATDFVEQNYSEVRWARNMALLNMSLMDAAIAAWDAKYYYFNPRPCQIDPRIKSCIGLPNFPSYISGHSTFSGAAASVLSYIIPAKTNTYNSYAKAASDSRLYGAIHFRSDCEVGLTTGAKVGNLAVERGHIDGAE